MEAFLVAREGGAWRNIYRLAPSAITTLGREPSNQIVLQDDKSSRRHCDFLLRDETWIVRDLESRNGTRVNGEYITEDRPLRPGDVVRIGAVELLFTTDISQPLDAVVEGAGGERLTDESEIIERKAQTRFMTQSRLYGDDPAPALREAFARLYGLVVNMVQATDAVSLCETVLDGLLSATSADIGAVLVFPGEVEDRGNPDSLRVAAYRAPAGLPYRKVSARLSRAALKEQEAILGVDIGKHGESFQTLYDMQAQSVICAPLRYEGTILGLLHLYSLQSSNVLGADGLEFALAVADQLAVTLDHLNCWQSLSGELERVCDQNRSLRRLLEIESDLVGDSRAMRQLRDTIGRVAQSDATALVRGESGVGKELVARAIHFNSNRREQPFVCMNCAALTETLLESELFGHEKGSFTGATERKIGKFEQAHGGTLFLDEVGDMPPSIQAKFLRVLEGHAFERVGGNQDIHVDVRVVAATNRDLESAVEAGDFRNDLFFRLQILEIDVASLREHADDIPALTVHFLERCCQRLGKPLPRISRQAMQLLTRHDWPGNVRELRNVIERAVVLCDGAELGPQDIRFTARNNAAAWLPNEPAAPCQPASLEQIEREHILRTLQWTNGNKREAAKILGINRSTLDRKLARYEIQPPVAGNG